MADVLLELSPAPYLGSLLIALGSQKDPPSRILSRESNFLDLSLSLAIDFPVMESSKPEPEQPMIPPPDLPKPSIPPPTIPSVAAPDTPPGSGAPALSGPPVVNVRIQPAGEGHDEIVLSHVAFHNRVAAALIDCLLAAGISLSALWILPGFAEGVAWLVGAAYLVMRDSLAFLGGQSIGKKAMNIRLVTLGDQSLVGDWKSALIRNGVLFIPFFALIEIFILLTREERSDRGKRLGDEWAKTKIIPDRSKIEESAQISP